VITDLSGRPRALPDKYHQFLRPAATAAGETEI